MDIFNKERKATRAITGLILDLTIIGGMGGKDVAERIRSVDMDMPIFAASGYSDDPIMENPVEYGFTASISKPFRKGELANMLDKYISKSSKEDKKDRFRFYTQYSIIPSFQYSMWHCNVKRQLNHNINRL